MEAGLRSWPLRNPLVTSNQIAADIKETDRVVCTERHKMSITAKSCQLERKTPTSSKGLACLCVKKKDRKQKNHVSHCAVEVTQGQVPTRTASSY